MAFIRVKRIAGVRIERQRRFTAPASLRSMAQCQLRRLTNSKERTPSPAAMPRQGWRQAILVVYPKDWEEADPDLLSVIRGIMLGHFLKHFEERKLQGESRGAQERSKYWVMRSFWCDPRL